jgi:2-iminobutanoate/2-iminopropanoate deaminase
MVRPRRKADVSRRSAFVLGTGTNLGSSGAQPLMSDAIRWGGLLFLSGRAAVDPDSGQARGDHLEEQCAVVLADIGAVLAEGGSDLEHVLRVECCLAHRSDFAAWNAIFIDAFPEPRPARTTLVGELPLPGLLIELQVTAGIPS